MTFNKPFAWPQHNTWSGRLCQRASVIFWGVVLVAPFAAHVAIATGHHAGLATGLAGLEILTIAGVAVRSGSRALRVAGLLLAGGLAVRLLVAGAFGALMATSGMCHALLYAGLLGLFARSLRPGRTDLVTAIALQLDDARTPDRRRYTRWVTKAWCGFFAAQLLGSAVLLALAPRAVWSLFVNVLDGPSVVLMFAAEYLVRRLRFRHERHVSPLRIWRSYVQGSAGRRLG